MILDHTLNWLSYTINAIKSPSLFFLNQLDLQTFITECLMSTLLYTSPSVDHPLPSSPHLTLPLCSLKRLLTYFLHLRSSSLPWPTPSGQGFPSGPGGCMNPELRILRYLYVFLAPSYQPRCTSFPFLSPLLALPTPFTGFKLCILESFWGSVLDFLTVYLPPCNPQALRPNFSLPWALDFSVWLHPW